MSRITHRKGLADDLPPELSAAELGWVLDERKLYIGNGALIDGAPVTGNTEILTEFSNILGASSAYTYSGLEAAGYAVVTGDGVDILRSLQSKFDDFASVKDFGAVGDGIVDDTDAINRALFELFCIGTNPGMKRSLYFPAGIYRVTGSIKIPPHAKLWGEGLTSSIIEFISSAESVTLLEPGVKYKIVTPGTTDFTLYGAVNSLADTIFVANGTDSSGDTGGGTALKWAVDVVETADSLQQTGANMTSNSAIAPTGIEMNAMGIHSGEDNTLLKLDSVTNSGFSYLGLAGPNVVPSLALGTTAIEIASSVLSSVTSDVTISKLITSGTTYGLRAAGRTKGIVLETSGLSNHYKGVYITNPTIDAPNIVTGTRYKIMAIVIGDDFTTIGATYNRVGETFISDTTGPAFNAGSKVISMETDAQGPTGIVITRNIFDNIAHEGIHFENTLFNSSGHNVFYNVGTNNGGGTGTAVSPIITMDTDQCVSVGDLFEREDESGFPRIELNGNGGIYLDGTHSIHLGSYERQVGLEAPITVATDVELISSLNTVPNSYKVDYNIKNDSNAGSRMGTMTVSVFGANVTFADEFTESGAVAVTLDVVTTGTNNESKLQFTSTEAAVINFSVVRLD